MWFPRNSGIKVQRIKPHPFLIGETMNENELRELQRKYETRLLKAKQEQEMCQNAISKLFGLILISQGISSGILPQEQVNQELSIYRISPMRFPPTKEDVPLSNALTSTIHNRTGIYCGGDCVLRIDNGN
jgi:hypothetical protein